MSDTPTGALSTSDIARLANVDLSTVSNWRKRFSDTFPPRLLDAESTRPRFDRRAVEDWLRKNPQLGGTPGPKKPTLSIHAILDIFRGSMHPSEAFDFLGSALIIIASMDDDQRTPELVFERASSPSTLPLDMHGLTESPAWSKAPIDQVMKALSLLIGAGEPRDLFEQLLSGYLRSNSSANEHATPEVLIDLLLALSPDGDGDIFDLAAGTGGLLLATIQAGKATAGTGVDVNEETVRIARRRAYLTGIRITMLAADSLTADPLAGKVADLVLVDSPLGMSSGQARELFDAIDWPFGAPSANKPDWAWPQLAISHLAPGGTAIVVTAISMLSQTDRQSSSIRNELIRRGAVRSVIALPSRLRANTHIPLAVWVLGQPDEIDRRTSVLLIDATSLNADALGSDGPVVTAYENWRAQRAQDLDRSFAVDVPVVDLLAPDATLLPNRWTIDPTEHLSAQDWTTAVIDSYSAASTAVSALGQALPSLKVTPLQEEARTMSIGELQKSGAIAVLRGRHMERDLAETAPQHPILTIRHVRPGADLVGIETEHVLASPSTTAQLVHKGDVIVYLDGSTVSARVWPENGWVLGRFMQSIRVLDGSLDPEYLAAAIAAPVNEKFMAAGASRTHFNLKEFVVMLPSIAVQRAFADAQERVNDALKRLRQAAHALEAAKRQLALAAASGSVSIEASEARK